MIRILMSAAAVAGLLAPSVGEAGGYYRRHYHAPAYAYGYGHEYRPRDLYGGTGDFAPRPSSYRVVEAVPVQPVRYSYTSEKGWVRLGETEAPRDGRPAAPARRRR